MQEDRVPSNGGAAFLPMDTSRGISPRSVIMQLQFQLELLRFGGRAMRFVS